MIHLTATITLLALVNISVNAVLPSWAYVPTMIVAGAATVMIARRAGASDDDLGLSRANAGRSALIGVAVGMSALTLIVIGSVIPGLRDLYLDERTAGIGIAGLLYQTVIRIPLGTAIGEELMFRSGLLGLCLRNWGRRVAIVVSSVTFGLWHILPTLSVLDSNASVADRSAAPVVIAAVLSTAGVGVFFAWLRMRTSHVAATVILHAMVNSAAFAAAYFVIS